MGYFKGTRARTAFSPTSSRVSYGESRLSKSGNHQGWRRSWPQPLCTPYLLSTAAIPQWYDESAEHDQHDVTNAAIESPPSQSDSSSSSYCPPVSTLIPSTPLYGSGSLPHLPNTQSILHSPLPVAEASRGTRASPFPSFHTTRCTPTSGGHAPVPTALVLFWRVADGRLCVSCNSVAGGVSVLLVRCY